MKNISLVILTMILLASCATYRTSTNFFTLERGITKVQFINWSKPSWTNKNGRPIQGGKPLYTKMFKHRNDIWEVWVFKVYEYSPISGYGFDHYEHVAFRNNKLEEWGTGKLPITIRQNPNQFQYDININK